MPLLAPLALAGLLFIPLIVAFYLLRLRRAERTVSSTFLWQQLVRDLEANAPWQRLRRSLLLLLQLLLVAVLVLAAARPFQEHPAGLARDLILVIDASASMGATDAFPDRLTAAKRAAVEALAGLPADGKVSIVAAAETARVVANEVTDRGRAADAIAGIALSHASTDMGDALKLAGALAARARGAEVLVVTDDASIKVPDVHLEAPIKVITVGKDRRNQAIVALAVQSGAGGVKRSLFVSVANLDAAAATRRLQVFADGVAFTARDLFLDPLTRTDVVIDELPAGAAVVEARLAAVDGTTGPPDQLSADDTAWAIVPSDRLQRILLVGPGNVYLQNALSLLPNVELYGSSGADYAATTGLDKFDLVVFDGYLPPTLPDKPILAIAPPRSSPLGIVLGTLNGPGIGTPASDEPLLHDVDLTRIHVARAQRIDLPAWARTVIPGPRGSPLLYVGNREGLVTAVLAFDLHQSDLPLQVAWPILVANLSGELLGRDASTLQPVRPGAPVELLLPPGSAGMRVTAPDGTVTELVPGATGASSVTFVGTGGLGVYRAESIAAAPKPLPSGASPAPTTAPTAAASPSPSGTASEVAVSSRFAVDLFDPAESNIAPGDGARLAALGGPPASGGEVGVARDEWWVPVVLAILVLLLLEWLVYERDGARRIRDRLVGIVTLRAFRARRAGRSP
jgi:hypothetical protein